MKKIVCVLFFILSMSVLCAEIKTEPYIVMYDVMWMDTNRTYSYIEYTLYEDGLIKTVKEYDINELLDLYNWQEIKKNARIKNQYEVKRIGNNLIEYFIENGNKTIYKKLIIQEAVSKKETIHPFILDDKVEQVIRFRSNPNLKPILINIKFDGRNQYISTYPSIDGFVFENQDYVFISEYIPFSEEARVLNKILNPYEGYCDYVLEVPVIQKERYEYSNTEKDTLIFSRQEINISTSRGKENLKDVSIEDINGMSYVFLEGKKQGLLLKNSDFSVYYRENDETPFFMGWDGSQNRKIVEQTEIKSSTFLKEGKVSYVAENVKELKLKAPWAEGAEGNGEGEYIQFNKAEADGMYIVNGYVSMDRPDLYEKNGRVKEFTVTGLKSGIVQEEYILDSAKPQCVSLKAFENEPVRITVKSVYSGTKYEDTCISGIVLVKEK